ncbi:LamG-like jellyroll fold domain-containing protein [Cohnella sp.]|uniref:LamG-like jellyroll fold domain-containing protein n=1 Tax=Cohnella sp. TaxID=1883426 RepID=UPI003567124A
MRKNVFMPLKNITKTVNRVLAVSLLSALILQIAAPVPAFAEQSEVIPAATAVANENGYLDKLVFGDAASESAHNYKGDFTSVITGFLGEPARVSNPRIPAAGQGGDLTFTMKVDPSLRNYLTVKFSGEESNSGYTSMVNINGEQVGFFAYGDYEAINKGWMLPNRFYYNTIMLPLESTAGKEIIEITIKTWGNSSSASRGYYNAYTHTQADINVDGEKQGYKFKADQNPDTMLPPDLTDAEKQAKIDGYTQGNINLFNNLSAKVDAGAGGKMSIIRYQDELKFYASALKYSWSPAKTPEEKKAALQRIFKTIDNHVKDYYGNTRLVLRGGHQGDWGGYYGALGEAMYIVENLIKDDSINGEAAWGAFLDQPFVTGSIAGEFSLAGVDWNGGELTRREAWERVLKANFDFARTRLSYIYNQVLYTYEGAWEAHEGLRLIGSPFFEGKERSHQILLESLGIRPFLGEEVLVGPSGEELDLYHSLFYHDAQAQFTDDFVHIVGKGLAKSKLDAEGNVVRRLPYGKHYTGLTEAGLTRENGYVANYGEAANYVLNYYYKTLNHAGDEEINDEILKAALKSIHARGFVRYSSLDGDGKRVMRAEQVTDERNSGLTGFPAYGARVGLGMGMQYASLEMEMSQNEQRYSGPEWDKYWQYAKEAVGFVQQQLADRQFLHVDDFGSRGTNSSPNYLLSETYKYVTADRANYSRFGGKVMAGAVLPQTDFDSYKPEEIAALGVNPDDYERFAWADIDNLYVSVKDGDFRMFGALYYRNRGTASNGRLHVLSDNYDRMVQIATNNRFRYEDYYIRPDTIDWDFQSDRSGNWTGVPQGLTGEVVPASYQPGVGTVNRDNMEVDNPYSGYPELQTSRYGKYFMVFNTTRDEYGNKQTFEVELPTDFSGSSVLDLVSGTNIPVVNGKVTVAPKTAMVLKLNSDFELAQKPLHVDFVQALAGNGYAGVSWKTTSGGQTYTVKRSETEDGAYEIIASGVTGNYYKDTTVQNGKVYYYKVAAVNENGSGWDSWRAKADLSASASDVAQWRNDALAGTTGSAAIDGSSVVISGVNGTGLGQGDDYYIYNRDINDSLHFVNRVAAGSSTISAKIVGASGEVSGIMMRDRLTADKARYIYFGADENGNLVLQTRTRVSFVQWSGEAASPKIVKIKGYTALEYPYVKLMRDHDSQTVYAFVSKDGTAWTYVTKLLTLLPFAYYTGVVASDEGQFGDVTVTETPQGALSPFVVKVNDQATLYWNKPKQASWFNVYRTTDEAASLTDPEFKPGTRELVDGSPWTLVLAETRATSYRETNIRYGSVYYKLLPIHGDGSVQPFSAVTSITADSFAIVMQRAQSLPVADYTKASFYLFHKELDRINEAMAQPEADEEALINEIYAAYELLVSFRVNLQKVQVEPSMVRASEKFWNNDNISEAQNGWFIFDGILTNITHTRSAISWVDVDFGAGNEKAIDTFRYLPREGSTTLLNRANNTVFKGSNDGVNWVDLHKITGVTEFKWYSAVNPDTTPYRYIRIYDDHNGFVNFTEVEFLERGIDKTLVTYLLGEASAAIESGIYTAESLQPVEQAVPAATSAEGNVNATQEEVDAASANLLTALEGLEYVPGMPVLAAIGNKTVVAESTLTFTVQATNAAAEVVYGVEGLPAGASFNAETQTFNWTPAKEQGGVHSVTFTATSGELASSQTIKITVKGQPIIEPDTTVELTAKQLFTYQVPATDPTGEELVYSVGELPTGALFDAAAGVFSWMPSQADYGNHLVTFTVSNGRFAVSQKVDLKVNLYIHSPEDYTKGSYYLYMKEVKRIAAEIVKPEANKAQLAAELDQAEMLLDHVPSSLYSFEGNANNSFGASHGIVEGAPVYTEGKIGQAINLNGTDEYVSLPSTHALSTSDAITVATWVNWKGGNQWQRIFDFGNDRNQYLFLTPRSGNNTLRFAIKNGGGEQLIQTSQLPANQWVHVAVTLGSGTAKLYVNGEQKATASNFTIKPSDFKPKVNYIGKSQWPDPLYNGMIDEFRVYNYVLGAEEIKAAMSNTAKKWIDNTLLPVLLAEASAINTDHYTEESVAALQAAVSEAELVSANANATQAEIDAAAAKMQEALEGLVFKITASLEPSAPNGLNGWYTTPVTVTLSTYGAVQYSLDEGTNWIVYEAPVTLNQEGANKIVYRPVKNGEPKSIEVKIDLTAPLVNIVGEASYTIDQMVTLTCSASDVTSSVYGSPCDQPVLQVKAYTLNSGQNSVTVTVQDMAGLQTTVTHTFTVTATFDSLKTITTVFLQATAAKGWEGVVKSLNYKLDQAKAAADRGDTAAVKDIMESYIVQVKDQVGYSLTSDQANILIRWAQTTF